MWKKAPPSREPAAKDTSGMTTQGEITSIVEYLYSLQEDAPK